MSTKLPDAARTRGHPCCHVTEALPAAFQDAPVAMLLASPNGFVHGANRAWCALSGLPVERSLGEGWRTVLSRTDQTRIARALAGATSEPPYPSVDAPLLAPATGRWGRWAVSAAPVVEDAPPSLVITLTDLTVDHARTSQLRHAATHDLLTGAVNRSLFLEATGHAVARLRRRGGFVGILYLDLDGFKEVNDRWGHLVGDQVLATQSARLRDTIRPADVLARLGGDEFAVLCEDLDGPEQIGLIAHRAASRLAEPIVTERGTVRVPASVGAVITGTAAGVDHLLDVADHAMYQAKGRRGPPQVVVDLSVDTVEPAAGRP